MESTSLSSTNAADALARATLKNEHVFKRDSYKYLKFDLKFSILFLTIGLVSFFQTILQIIFSINSNNLIYFVACFLFGPLQLFATLLLLLINCFSNIKTKYCLATWATRLLTIGFIPFVNTIALNCFYLVDCYKTDNRTRANGINNSEMDFSLLGDDASDLDYDYCANIIYNIVNIILGLVCVFLNLFFCIPFNTN